MPRIRLNSDHQLSAVKAMYEQGIPIKAIAEHFGCNHKTVRSALVKAGVTITWRRWGLPKPDAKTLRREYWDDRQPTTMLAEKYGVQWSSVWTWLKEYDIPRRSASEAKKLDMERWSHADRLRITEASRAIFSGKPRSHADRCRRAIAVENIAKLSRNEKMLLTALQESGLNPIPQMAIDKFNIDLAFPKHHLAIEIDGGCWHNTPQHVAGDKAKQEFLQSNGWKLIRVKTRRTLWVELAVARITAYITSKPQMQ